MNILTALPEHSLLLIVLGVAAGVLSAMLGIGGGTLMVPALVLIVGVSQKTAQGTALAVMIPVALVGAIRYTANPQVDMRIARVAILATGAIAGAFIGAAIARRVPGLVLRRVFAVFLLVVSVRMMWGARSGNTERPEVKPSPVNLANTLR